VEIDLLRGGGWALPDRSLLKPVPPGRVYHHVCVSRPPWLTRHEFYVLPMRQCLPAIRVPLRRTDPDAALDLQILVDQCYERGRYDSAIDLREFIQRNQLSVPVGALEVGSDSRIAPGAWRA
jgi:hypothetical protein